MWDIDMKGKAVKEKKDFVILGTDKGYIYFIDLKDKLKFYTRLHQHSNSIIKINLFKLDSEKKDEINFFSVTNNNEFAIWSLSFD